MKIQVPIEVDVSCKQAIEILKHKVESTLCCDWDDLIYEHNVLYMLEETLVGTQKKSKVKFETDREKNFILAVFNLIEASEVYKV